jgi:hypothetical protein
MVYDPTTTVSATLVARHRASDLALSDGAAVATWTDTVSGFNATQGTAGLRPTYGASGLYLPGPVVRFSGTIGQTLQIAHSYPSTYTAFVVFACDNVGGFQSWQVLSSTSNRFTWAVVSNLSGMPAFWQGGAGTSYGIGATTYPDPNPLICGVKCDGTNTKVWFQGADVTGLNGAASGTGVAVAPGALTISSFGFNGEIAEILIYGGALSDAEMASVARDYLAYTYMPVTGLSVTPAAASGASGSPVNLSVGFLPALTGVYLRSATTPALADDLGTGTFGTPSAVAAGINPAAQTVAYTPATAGLRSATATASGLAAGSGAYLATTTGSTSIAYNNAAIYYPSGGWDDYGTYKSTNGPGNYFKTLFTGPSFAVSLSVSHLVAASVAAGSYPVLQYRVDGSAWTRTQLTSATTSLTLASGLTGAARHLVECYFVATDTALSRWNAAADAGSPVNSVRVTGFTLAGGQSVSSPPLRSKFAMIYGDSIGEGYQDVSPYDGTVPSQDATAAWPYLLAEALGCEYATACYAAQGYGGAGSAVPVGTAWPLYSAGRSRLSGGLFPVAPDYLISGHGSNENHVGDPSVAYSLFKAWRVACGANTRIVQLEPYGPGSGAAPLDYPYIYRGVAQYRADYPADKSLYVSGASQMAADGGLHYKAFPGHARYAASLAVKITESVVGLPVAAVVKRRRFRTTGG